MHPSLPKSRIVLALATTAALLASPMPSLGAKGAALTADFTALIGAVSPNGQMAFSASFENPGPSNIAHLRFDGSVPGATFVSGTAPCQANGPGVGCALGNLAAGRSVKLTLLFNAPSSSGILTLDGAFSGDAGQNNSGAAKRDTWTDPSVVNVTVNGSGDFFGSWQRSHGGQQTFQTSAISGNNHQSTRVVVPAVTGDYPATINEVIGDVTCGTSAVGQAVDLSIANGAPVEPYLQVTLRLDAVAAEGRTPSSIGLLHDCEPVPAGCRKSVAPCYDASWERNGRDKVLVIVVQLPSNGRLKII